MPQVDRVPLRTVLSHATVPVLMGLIMAVAYLGGFHKPQPHAVPLAIVGPTQQVQPIATALSRALGDKADVQIVATQQDAVHQIKDLRLTGAYLPGKTSATVLVSTMASDAGASAATQLLGPIAAEQGRPLTTREVTPVPPSDPIGQNAFFYLVALTVGSYATSIAIGAAGATRTMRVRTGLALGAAVVIASAGLFIARAAYGMFPGDLPPVWGLSLLYCAAVLLIGVGLHPVFGRFCTLVYSAVFVAVNFTTCGGVFPPYLQPAFFGWLHHFWIGAGFIESVDRVLYFPQVRVTGPLAILFGWLLFGVLCVLGGHRVERRRALRGESARPAGALSVAVEAELAEDVAV